MEQLNYGSLIFVIDGNIGVGKTTLLRHLKQNHHEINFSGEENTFFYEEDIVNFENTGPVTLDKFYKNPKRYAFQFQRQVI